jgi:hypothetical protein
MRTRTLWVGGDRNAAAAADVGLLREASCRVSCGSRLLFPRSFGRGRGSVGRIAGTYLSADTAAMAKKREPPKLFWLTYRHSDGRVAGVVVIESHGLLQCSLQGFVGRRRSRPRIHMWAPT